MSDQNKIFVGNLAYNTTTETLTSKFSEFGEVVECYKPQDKNFAFVKFKDAESVQKAIDAMEGQDLDGNNIHVSVARPREDKPRSFDNNRRFSRGGGRNSY